MAMDKTDVNREKKRGSQILDSKMRIPETAHSLIVRTKLMMEAEQAGGRITVINAGAGFGKTILMAEMARKYDGQYIWYQNDPADNDPISFLRGLLYSLTKLSKLLDVPMGELDENENVHSVVLSLAEWLSQSVKLPFYFMFDDFHEITDESVFIILKHLIDYTPDEIRFCFTVKGGFPRFLASYILKGKAYLVESAKLRFTEEETGRLLRRLTGHEIEEQVIKNISDYMEGWPAGVMFAGLALKADSSQGDIASVLIHTKIYDYIFYEVFRKLPFEIQRFLMDTASLQSLSVPLCNYVTGRIDSGSVLDYLVGENLFIYKFNGQKKWYRYHSIFQDFLLSRQESERKREILNKAAQYFLRAGEVEQAVIYGMKCMAYQVVEIAVEKNAVSLMQQGRQATVSQWIHFLEPELDRVGHRCLYAVYQCFLLWEKEKKAVEYLRLAAGKADQSGEAEEYGQYSMELLGHLEGFCGLRRAEKEACQMAERLKKSAAGSSFRLFIKILEYRLQLGELDKLDEGTGNGFKSRWKLHMTMARNAVEWILDLRHKESGWEHTLEDAQKYRALSPVFAEYGFFKYGWFLYLNHDPAYKKVLEEGISIGCGSLFGQWMRLLLIIQEYREKPAERAALVEEMRQIEEQMNRQEIDYPAFLEKDAKLLSGVIIGQEEAGQERERNIREDKVRTRLEVYCLGSFSVKAGGETLAWRTKKTRELFACLFVQNGKGLDKGNLIFRLWPDASEKNGSTLFNTTVSYLRKTLAQVDAADILIVKDRLYSLDMERIWSDYGRLEEIALLVRKGEVEALFHPQELAQLYNGEYLESEDYRWMVGRKEYVTQMFMRTAEKIAQWEEGRKHYDTAITILQKMVEVNSYSVGALRLLLKCRVESGDVNGAKRQYKKMRQIWKQEWDQELGLDFAEFIAMSEGDDHDNGLL